MLVDFDGDQPDILGVDVADRHGVTDWLATSEPMEISTLENLLVSVAPGLRLLPIGRAGLVNSPGSVDPERIASLVTGLGSIGTVIGDLGVIGAEPTSPRSLIGAASDRRTLLVRPCYLALRRARNVPIRFDSLVEVYEGGRALRTLDVEAVMGMAVCARLRVDPAIARSVDGATLVSRRPRSLRRFIADLQAEHRNERFAERPAIGDGEVESSYPRARRRPLFDSSASSVPSGVQAW